MRFVHRGVLLGTVLSLFIFCKQATQNNDHNVCVVTQSEQSILPDGVSISCKPTAYSGSMTVSKPVTKFDVVCAYIQDNNFCQWYFKMTTHEIKWLMKVSYAQIVSEILKLDHLSSKQMAELWCLYKRGCHKPKEVDKCQQDLFTKLQQRKENFEQELKRKEEVKKQKQAEQSTLGSSNYEEQVRLEYMYHTDILSTSNQDSPYFNDRQVALQNTKDQQYKKYKQSRELDEQTVGLCIAKNIDYKQLQCSNGTAMQQQLYDEVADCYKKISKFFCQQTLGESILASQSLEFAQCVAEATEIEAMELAIALSDLTRVCTDIACSIIAGFGDAVEGIADVITNPVGIAKNIGSCLSKVMNYVSEAMVYVDSESLGWSHYAQVLEQEHHYDAEYAQQVIDTMQDWIIHSSVQEKIRMGTRCVVDEILYGNLCKLLSHTSKACCGLIADIPELRFLGEFTDVYAEYGLATELGEVGVASMEDIGISVLKSEMKMASDAKAISTKLKQIPGKRVIDEIFEKQEHYKKYKPKEVKTNCLLDKNLKIAEDAKKEAARIRKLSDGRVRFYQAEDLASTPGPTRGATHVTEYDPHRGIVRGWRESYAHNGNVNRVHPKMFNGKNIKALHYPHTGQELKEIASKLKGK